MSSNPGKEKAFVHCMNQLTELTRSIVREHGDKYLNMHRSIEHLRKEYTAQGFSFGVSYVLASVVFRKFYDTIVLESKNPESEFMKLPMEWQWDVCADLNDAEMEEALKKAKIIEKNELVEVGSH